MKDRSGDAELVRRAARRVAVQVAAAVGAAMLALLLVLMAVVVRGQNSSADNLLRHTAVAADDVSDPPPGTWIVFRDPVGVEASAGLPHALTSVLTADAATATARAQLTSYTTSNAHFRILTQRIDKRVVQVVLNRITQQRERHHLFRAAAVVALAGLLAAAGVGLVVGRRAVRPLVTALALQRRFVADAGHELRTPLTVLSTRAQLLQQGLQRGEPNPEVTADVAGLVEDVRRLGAVIEDLLAAADPRESQPRTAIDLAELADQVVTSTAAHASTAGVRLARIADGPALVLGSEPALRRAVLALVDNAIDHTPAGGQVEVTICQQRGDVVLTVADTGPGIAAGDAERIFQRFSSGGQRAGRTHYGLGLALTHDVVDRHGGRMRLVPGAPGSGATFEITLPLARG